MSVEVAEQGIDFLIKGAKKSFKKNFSITFFGGEPTLEIPLLNHMFDYAIFRAKEEELKVDFTLITNGMIFNTELQNFILKWKKTLSKVNIQFSFDGTPDTQSAMRPFYKKDDYFQTSGEKMEYNLNLIYDFCLKNNIVIGEEVYIHAVIPKKQLSNLYNNYKYFTEKGFKGFWYLLLLEDDWDKEDVLIYEKQLNLIFDYIVENKYFDHFFYNKNFHKKNHQPQISCAAGRQVCCFSPDGTIYACHRLYSNDKNDILGYLNKDGKIWINEEKKQLYDKLLASDLVGERLCRDCSIPSCNRCLAANKENNGLLTLCFPAYCRMAKIEYNIQLKIRNYLNENNLTQYMNFEENNSMENNINQTLESLVKGFKELTEILAEGFNKLEQKQNDLLNLYIANLIQNNHEN